MGKAIIQENLGDGHYRVLLEFDNTVIDKTIGSINTELQIINTESLPETLAAYTDAQTATDAAQTAYNSAVDIYAADPSPENETAMKGELSKYQDAVKEELAAKGAYEAVLTRKLALDKRLAELTAARQESVSAIVWCADLADGLDGRPEHAVDSVVGSVEIAGDTQRRLVRPKGIGSETYTAARDGMVSVSESMSIARQMWNFTMLPGWQVWMPRYLQCTIESIDRIAYTCTVRTEQFKSGHHDIVTVGNRVITGVTFNYMDCAATKPFVIGDKVLVEFPTQDPDVGVVIGFADGPRYCDPGAFVCQIKDDSCASGYGDPVTVAPGTCAGPNPDKEIIETAPGTWTVFHSNSYTYGNVDWRGLQGEILSWDGPVTRYGAAATVPGTVIYRNGAAFAQCRMAIANTWLIGAAIVKDEAGTQFLLAVTMSYADTSASTPMYDKVYVKTLVTAGGADPGDYDASTNPNGWRLIGSWASNTWNTGSWLHSRWLSWQTHHWMFNASGTEAGVVRGTVNSIMQEQGTGSSYVWAWSDFSGGAFRYEGEMKQFDRQYLHERYRISITKGTGIGAFSAAMEHVPDEHQQMTTTVDVNAPAADWFNRLDELFGSECDSFYSSCSQIIYNEGIRAWEIFLTNTYTRTAKVTGKSPYAVDYRGDQEVVCYMGVDTQDIQQYVLTHRWYGDAFLNALCFGGAPLGDGWACKTNVKEEVYEKKEHALTGTAWLEVNGVQYPMMDNSYAANYTQVDRGDAFWTITDDTMSRSDLMYLDLRTGSLRTNARKVDMAVRFEYPNTIFSWDEVQRDWTYQHDGAEVVYSAEALTPSPTDLTQQPVAEVKYWGGLVHQLPLPWTTNLTAWPYMTLQADQNNAFAFNMQNDFNDIAIKSSAGSGKYDTTTSSEYVFTDPAQQFNFFSAGDLDTITEVPGTNPFYYPMGRV